MMTEYDELKELNPDALVPTGFVDAYMGYAEREGLAVAVFDADKCLEILQRDGMTYEEAQEFFNFNVLGAHLGENTPLFLWRKCPYPDCVVCEDEGTQEVE